MHLKTLTLVNFRSFEKLEVTLDERCNVLVGVNGSGKSSILEAAAVAMGSYLSKIPLADSRSIQKEDARVVTRAAGSRISADSQFPVIIKSTGVLHGQNLTWERALNGMKNRTTVKDALEIIDMGKVDLEGIQAGNSELILPIIAYYGTGRLYKKKTTQNTTNDTQFSRLDGYRDTLASGTNEQQLFKWFSDMSLIQTQEGKLLPELEAVKKAMVSCFEVGNPKVSEAEINYSFKTKEIEITYRQDGQLIRLPLHLFSDGIRITLTMVADIASRMAKLNPDLLEKVLETPGVVLIDEIDMHLHPSWQSKVVKSLLDTFPNVQFITTTHSPVVISNIETRYLKLLKANQIFPVENSYGKDVRNILNEIMETNYRPQNITNKIDQIYNLIDESKLQEAEELLNELQEILGVTDSDVVSATTALELEKMFEDD